MGMSITSQKNFNIMSAKEKEAAAQQTFTFLAYFYHIITGVHYVS